MTIGKALDGKPCAGNSHVAPSQCYGGTCRFAEGDVSSVATLQHGSRLYNIVSVHILRRIVVSALLFAMCCNLQGCRETYADPEKFLRHYTSQFFDEKVLPRSWFDEMELTKLAFEDVRLEAQGDHTTVCATLRFLRKSDKTVYSQRSFLGDRRKNRLPALFSWGKILSPKEIADSFCATVQIPRTKMDNGVFAPSREVTWNTIQGFGTLKCLQVADIKAIRKQTIAFIDDVTPQIRLCKTAEGMETIIDLLEKLLINRYLYYVDDKKKLEQYRMILEESFAVYKGMPDGRRNSPRFLYKESLSKFDAICRLNDLETTYNRVETALRRSDYESAQMPARLLFAVDNDSPIANFALGMWHYVHKRYEPAEEYLHTFNQARPKDPIGWNNLAMIFLETGRLDVAKYYAGKALSLAPKSANIKDTVLQIENAIRQRNKQH